MFADDARLPFADLVFAGVAALVFTASVAMTIVACAPTIAGMQICGAIAGHLRERGGGLSFVAMWTVMMVAMMLPSLMPALCRYRDAARGTERLGVATLLASAGYFFVWALCGVVVLALATALPSLASATPFAVGCVMLTAGALQFTGWKARTLACCRGGCGQQSALRWGVRHGLQCVACCAGPTAVLLVLGMMDLRAMAAVTVAITAERLAGLRVARALGVVAIGAGLVLVAGL
ncbi:DUF2182 domain-containing protein [Roseiterribacter gracilis]|uniref:DUF2182 domain-containing protein n=1 Tax=Roseiterribacter gracilis TaxID=2812848 RepID=A0A8S8X6C3_9PROT|nr:hypothetical protein TMPK1_04000 [Rhodospirillales bacterium TMPK1]